MRIDQGKVVARLRHFHEDFRVPRAVAEVRVSQQFQGFDKGHKAPQRSTSSTNVLQGSNVSRPRRLKSHRSSKLRAQKIALLMGGTLSKTEINGFSCALSLCCQLLTCSGNARALWQTHCVAEQTLGITEYYLVGFWVPRVPRSCEATE